MQSGAVRRLPAARTAAYSDLKTTGCTPMDQQQELAFIEHFVRRERRERARLELLTPRRRSTFLNRLCHSYADILDMRHCTPVPAAQNDRSGVLALLRRGGAPADCYAISHDDAIDGRWLLLAEALQAAVGLGLPSVLICRAGRLAYFEAEQAQGPPPRLLLQRGERPPA